MSQDSLTGGSEPGSEPLDDLVHDLEAKTLYCVKQVEAKCPERHYCVKKYARVVKRYCWRLKGY